MKNKNIKNKPQKCGRCFSCILDFPKFSGGEPPDPLIKGVHQLNPENLSSTTTAAPGKKKKKKKKKNTESPPHHENNLQEIYL